MQTILKSLATAILAPGGSPLGELEHAATEAYLANLSDSSLTLTALLPDDAEAYRSLTLSILAPDSNGECPLEDLLEASRERTLMPGEVVRFALKRPPTANHTSLFRVRKEGQAVSWFLKYTVTANGAGGQGALAFVSLLEANGKLQNVLPHLVYVW